MLTVSNFNTFDPIMTCVFYKKFLNPFSVLKGLKGWGKKTIKFQTFYLYLCLFLKDFKRILFPPVFRIFCESSSRKSKHSLKILWRAISFFDYSLALSKLPKCDVSRLLLLTILFKKEAGDLHKSNTRLWVWSRPLRWLSIIPRAAQMSIPFTMGIYFLSSCTCLENIERDLQANTSVWQWWERLRK